MNAHLLTIYAKFILVDKMWEKNLAHCKLSGLVFDDFGRQRIHIQPLTGMFLRSTITLAIMRATSSLELSKSIFCVYKIMDETKIVDSVITKYNFEEGVKIATKMLYASSRAVNEKHNEIYSQIARRGYGHIPNLPIREVFDMLLPFEEIKHIIPFQLLSYLFDVYFWINWMSINYTKQSKVNAPTQEEYKKMMADYTALVTSLGPRISDLYVKLLASKIDVKMDNIWPVDILPDDLKRIVISYDVMDGKSLCSDTFYQRLLDCKEIAE